MSTTELPLSPMRKTVTIKDIAQEAGVSLMTVSRALRKQPVVSTKLKARIQEIADRLGYQPNPLVSALMSQRRAGKPAHYNLKLGYITQFPTRAGWKKIRIFGQFYDGAALGAARHGYQLEEFWLTEPGMTPQRMSKILITRNIHGLIIAPMPLPGTCVDFLWEHFSAVAIAYSLVEPGLHRIAHNHFNSMRLIMQKLWERGYRRPGLAMRRSLDERIHHQWLGGLLAEQKVLFKSPPVQPFLVSDEDWTETNFRKWLDRARPDVIIGHHLYMEEWLQNSNRRVPEDIGLVNVDCPSRTGRASGIYENAPEIGEAASDSLVAILQRNERGVPDLPRTVLIQGVWVNGSTLRLPVRPET
jgi:LacI family transcriptional regulator